MLQLISSELAADKLLQHPPMALQMENVRSWLKSQPVNKTKNSLLRRSGTGYSLFFNGPAGVGKKTSAALLGKELNKPVYRVDLSLVVSKYIGETENNLSQLFEQAEEKDYVLLFDEADALFGKRTNVKDAHDKYALQVASMLLDKIEDHPGLVIVTAQSKVNIDPAFIRRFKAVVDFPVPPKEGRWSIFNT